MCKGLYIYIYIVGDRSRGRPEGSFFNSYYIEMGELLLSLNCSTLPLIRTVYCCVKQGGIKYHFKVFV